MLNWFIYIIESTICLSLFFFIYKTSLYKQTKFTWNRYYFFTALIISLLLPLWKIQAIQQLFYESTDLTNIKITHSTNGNILMIVKSIAQNNLTFNFLSSNKYFNIINIISIIYFSGVIRFAIKYIFNFISIKQLIKNGEKYTVLNRKVIIAKTSIPAFSFGNKIFVNNAFMQLEENEQEIIFRHEEIHIKQRHTFDLLIFELVRIIFWFNPIMKNTIISLKEIHEFIVDQNLANNNRNKHYTLLMLKLTGKSNIRQYNSNQVKNRIEQLINPLWEKTRKIRFISGIPLLIIILTTYFLLINIFEAFAIPAKHNENELLFPISGKYKIITPFFINKKIIQNHKNTDGSEYRVNYTISHPRISVQTTDYAKVISSADGIVRKIEQKNNWGINEYTIVIEHNNGLINIIEGVENTTVRINEKVKSGQQIAICGASDLYTSVSIQLLKDNTPIDPTEYFKDRNKWN